MTDDETYTFRYDFANGLVAAVRQSDGDTIGQYVYDALGRRVKKVVDDVSDTLDGTTLFWRRNGDSPLFRAQPCVLTGDAGRKRGQSPAFRPMPETEEMVTVPFSGRGLAC